MIYEEFGHCEYLFEVPELSGFFFFAEEDSP